MTIFEALLLLIPALVIGYCIKAFMVHRSKQYVGTIIVATDELKEKTVYSLVLDDYPEQLTFRKEVIFKVDTSEQNSDRD